LSIEYTFPVSPFGTGGEFDDRVDEAAVGKAPRKKGGGKAGAPGCDPGATQGLSGGSVNAGTRAASTSKGAGWRSVLAVRQDGSRSLI